MKDLDMKNIYLSFFIIFLVGCAAPKTSIQSDSYEINLSHIEFECNSEYTECYSEKYSIAKIYDGNKIQLKENNEIFFEGENKVRNYLYEVFESRFLLITPVKETHYAGTYLIPRDLVSVYDLTTKKLYKFSSKKRTISGIKELNHRYTDESIIDLKRQNYNILTTVERIDIENGIIYLLLPDLKSIEQFKLDLISK